MKRLSIFAVGIAWAATAHAQFFPTPWYVELDGRWYETERIAPFMSASRPLLSMRGARMDLCNRTDGQPQAFGGSFYAFAGMFSTPIYQITNWRMHRPLGIVGASVLSITSAPGNIACAMEVPAPFNERIFRHGFELDGVAADGFDGTAATSKSEPLKITLNTSSGASCIFTATDAGLAFSSSTNTIAATGTFDCAADPYGTAWVLNGPTKWPISIPWRVGQSRSMTWFAFPAQYCFITAQPVSGQPFESMAITGSRTCTGIGSSTGQSTFGTCLNLNQSVTMTPAASGAYLLKLECSRGSLSSVDQRTVVVSPPL